MWVMMIRLGKMLSTMSDLGGSRDNDYKNVKEVE
jgi:hypothetical protein